MRMCGLDDENCIQEPERTDRKYHPIEMLNFVAIILGQNLIALFSKQVCDI